MSVSDVIIIGVVIFVVSLVFLTTNYMFNETFDGLLGQEQINSSQATVDVLQATTSKVINKMDYFFFGIFLALVLSLIVTSWFIGANPLFLAIYMIMTIMGVVFATVFANVFESFSQNVLLASVVGNFPVMTHILLNLPLYSTVIGVLGMFIVYVKR